MKVSTDDVATAFQDLIAGARSREDIASWASSVRAADDAEGIEFDPPRAQDFIWNALEYLMGADLRDGPDSYLHNREDFEAFWLSKKGETSG